MKKEILTVIVASFFYKKPNIPAKYATALFLSFFFVFSYSQRKEYHTKEELRKNVKIISKEKKPIKRINPIFKQFPFIYNFCDNDLDGFVNIDLTPILEEVHIYASNQLGNTTATIIIGTSTGQLIRIEDIAGNPVTSIICSLPNSLADVAVDSK